MNFYDLYMDYMAPIGGSPVWAGWSGLGVVSALLERRVWWPVYSKKFFPNMYVLLLGAKGSGKNFAADEGYRLIDKFNAKKRALSKPGISMMASKLTPAALLEELAESKRQIKLNGSGTIYEYHSLFSYAPEFGSFILDIGGGDLAVDLTNLWDSQDNFTKKLKGQQRISIPNSSISALWCATPDFITRLMPQEMTREGFGSRLIPVPDLFVYDFEWDFPPVDLSLEEKLLDKMEQIHKLSGPVQVDDDVRDFFKEWIKGWNVEKRSTPKNGMFSDYFSRKPIHLRKLTMVLAGCRGSKHITLADAKKAVDLLEQLEPEMRSMFGRRDISRDHDAVDQVLYYMPTCGITKDELMRKMMRDGSVFPEDFRFDAIIRTLESAHLIVREEVNGVTTYTKLRDPDDDQ